MLKKIIKIFLIILVLYLSLTYLSHAMFNNGKKINIITQLLYAKNNENKEMIHYNSRNIYVYNLTDNEEVITLNADEKVYPASLVKIMTTYVALKNIDDLSEISPIDKKSYQKMVAMNSSMAGFVGLEQTTYRDLLYGTILVSGGECAETLAINICGNEENFVKKMNSVSKEIGLDNTHYKNVTGLDEEGQYTTAKDIAMLIKVCLGDGNFKVIFTKKNYISTKTLDHKDGVYMESRVLKKLKNYGYNGFEIIGGKSGTTSKAGLCWATLASKNGKEYIVVVMGVPFDDIRDTGDGQIEDTLNILKNIQ